jgi:predicted RNA-binding protein
MQKPLLACTETIVLWDLSSGQIIRRLMCSFAASEGGELAFGLHGVLAVAPLNEGVHLWDMQTGQQLFTLVDEERWYYGSPKSTRVFKERRITMYLNEAKNRARELSRIGNDAPIPCTREEVEALERWLL